MKDHDFQYKLLFPGIFLCCVMINFNSWLDTLDTVGSSKQTADWSFGSGGGNLYEAITRGHCNGT